MKTSARNQFGAVIVSMLQGPVNDDIGLLLNDKLRLIASITHESCRELQLNIGAKVFALIKASAVELSSPTAATSRNLNRLRGQIDTLTRGERRAELCITTDEELPLVVTVDNSVIDSLQLATLSRVDCYIDPSDMILAVAA
jgi:molybdate transport system regulatory protein